MKYIYCFRLVTEVSLHTRVVVLFEKETLSMARGGCTLVAWKMMRMETEGSDLSRVQIDFC